MSLVVLLVEDDFDLAETIVQYLELENIECDHAANGKHGLELIKQNSYDVLLIDIMLPKLDGLSLCEEARKVGVDTPILMLTARDTLDDKLAGFDAGTDDYLVKPFNLEEVTARVKALARRRSGQLKVMRIGDLVMDLDRRIVTRADVPLNLRPSGWILLEVLMRAYPSAVKKLELEQRLWPDQKPDSDSLKVHLHNLRQAVDKPFDKPIIITIPGHGIALDINEEAGTKS